MEINYLDFFRRQRKYFITVAVTAMIVSSVYVLQQPDLYQAVSKIYIEDGNNVRIAYALIKSNQLYDRVIERSNLIKVFGVGNIDQARKIISKNLQIVFDSRLNTIDIKIKFKDGVLASEMANVFTEELQVIYPSIRLPETNKNPLDFRVIDSAVPSIEPINQHKIEIIFIVPLLSIVAALFLSVMFENFSFRGLKKEQ